MREILDGAVVVVTGATRGIGRHVALGAADLGATVVVAGRTSRAHRNPVLTGTVEDTVDELIARGVPALGVQADLSDEDGTQRIVDRTLESFGRCDVLVNNAAYTYNGTVLGIPSRRWERGFRVQVTAPLQLCQGFVPGMVDRGSGLVVNVSSGASQHITPGLALYQTTKLAMERWSQHLAADLSGTGVAVNALQVDRVVATEGWHHILETRGRELAMGGSHDAEVMAPELAASHILWMLDRPATWTGQVVCFDDITALGGPPAPPSHRRTPIAAGAKEPA